MNLYERVGNIHIHTTYSDGTGTFEEIAQAATICHEHGIRLLGNGDVTSMKDAEEKIEIFGVDGVLVGRAACGKPWFFGGDEPEREKRFRIAIEHAKYFEDHYMDHAFFAMRKHLAWYCRGFEGAKEIRARLMQANSAKDVEEILLQKTE